MTRSNFPNSVDSFTELSEVLTSDKTDVDRYKVLLMQETRTSAEETELTNLKNKLANKLVSSEHFNYLQDAIAAVQTFFLNETVPYLDSLETGALRTDLGSPEYLETNDKTSLVNAVNELKENIEMDRSNNSGVFDDLYESKADILDAQMKKITADDGDVNIAITETTGDILKSIIDKGVGFNTFYAVSGSKNLPPDSISIRGISHITSVGHGYALAVDYRNQVYSNFLSSGTWLGWSEVSSKEQKTLWSGNRPPSSSHTTTPTKKLSQCRNGWIIVWSDFNSPNIANDYEYVFTYIPKIFASISNGGGSCLVNVPNYLSSSTKDYTVKRLYIYDDRIVGHDDNNTNTSGDLDVTMRYILEW